MTVEMQGHSKELCHDFYQNLILPIGAATKLSETKIMEQNIKRRY